MNPSAPRTSRPYLRFLPAGAAWIGGAAFLALTLVGWLLVRSAERERIEVLRNTQATEIQGRIQRRLEGLNQVLLGASGFLGRGELPSREEWHDYVSRLHLPEVYPGIQGMGFAQWIPAKGIPAHLLQGRSGGVPDYRIIPGRSEPPDPEGSSSILYFEPMDARSLQAFGKDMWADRARREALSRARDTGLVSMTGRVTLYQESATDQQAGTLIYAPVYRQGAPLDSVAARRKALLGWAFYPLGMTDLLGPPVEGVGLPG